MNKILLFALSTLSIAAQGQSPQAVATNDTIAYLQFPGFKQPTKPTAYAMYTGADTMIKITATYKAAKIASGATGDTIITIVKDSVKIPNVKKIHYFYQSYNNAQTQYAVSLGLANSFNTLVNTNDNNNTVLAASSNYPPGVTSQTADNWMLVGPITVPASAMTCKFLFGFTNNVRRDGFEIRMVEASKLDAKNNYSFPTKYNNYNGLQLNTLNDSAYVVANNFNGFKQSTLMSSVILKAYADSTDELAEPVVTPATPYTFTFDKAKMYSRSINLTAYRGTDVYVAIHHNATQQDIVFFDDILFREANNPTSIVTNNVNAVVVYPNPANDLLTITGANNAGITITNTLGQVVKTINTYTNTINIADLAKGMYVVTIVKDNEIITKKVIKN